ncbi:hypothetical protein Nepgr_022675 [Nepenthes gracilis]|uniref:Uncharacterized protein n=1 Tax=Nepenthes gracilis TaxID=150966 RepID=A0AAD3XX85_NEPGR|nr:hypothetical protein Nepgr_022675 [Nepenthes gracilis]
MFFTTRVVTKMNTIWCSLLDRPSCSSLIQGGRDIIVADGNKDEKKWQIAYFQYFLTIIIRSASCCCRLRERELLLLWPLFRVAVVHRHCLELSSLFIVADQVEVVKPFDKNRKRTRDQSSRPASGTKSQSKALKDDGLWSSQALGTQQCWGMPYLILFYVHKLL